MPYAIELALSELFIYTNFWLTESAFQSYKTAKSIPLTWRRNDMEYADFEKSIG